MIASASPDEAIDPRTCCHWANEVIIEETVKRFVGTETVERTVCSECCNEGEETYSQKDNVVSGSESCEREEMLLAKFAIELFGIPGIAFVCVERMYVCRMYGAVVFIVEHYCTNLCVYRV